MNTFSQIRSHLETSFEENPNFTLTIDDMFDLVAAAVPTSVDAKLLSRMKFLMEHESRTICLNTELVAFDILPPKYDDSEPITSIAKVRVYLDEQGIVEDDDYDVCKESKNEAIQASIDLTRRVCEDLDLPFNRRVLHARNICQDMAFASSDTLIEILLTSDKTRGCAIFWAKMIKMLVLYNRLQEETRPSMSDIILDKLISDGYQANLDRKKIFDELNSIKHGIENLDPDYVSPYSDSDVDSESSDEADVDNTWSCAVM